MGLRVLISDISLANRLKRADTWKGDGQFAERGLNSDDNYVVLPPKRNTFQKMKSLVFKPNLYDMFSAKGMLRPLARSLLAW